MSYRELTACIRQAVRGRLKGLLLGSAVALAAISGASLDGALSAQAQPAAPARRMNVLFIMADDLRVGSAFGSAEARTPNIDALAARGVRFDEAQCQFPLCGPSRASLLTGRRPNSTEVYDLTTNVRGHLADVVTMPQFFRQNGYFSARVGKMYHQGVPGMIGLPPKEDVHDDPASWDLAIAPIGADKEAEWDGKITNPNKLPYGIAMAQYADTSGKPHTDELIATKTIELIKAHKDKPFFIAAGFYRPHVPEVAPASYFDLYPNIAWRPEAKSDTSGVTGRHEPPYADNLTPEQLREFVRGYYASMSFMDAQVGRILKGLEESGVADNTIVVFTSDHGFNLGEHGHWQKMSLWRQSTRVPLIIYAPQAKGNGKAAAKPVELVDLYPTLSDLAGLPPAEGLEGHSLRPLIDNPSSAKWSYPALTQLPGGKSVRFENWRYSEWSGATQGVELYDLSTDPGEYKNLAALPRYASVVQKLKAMLPADPPPYTGVKTERERASYRDRVESHYRLQDF